MPDLMKAMRICVRGGLSPTSKSRAGERNPFFFESLGNTPFYKSLSDEWGYKFDLFYSQDLQLIVELVNSIAVAAVKNNWQFFIVQEFLRFDFLWTKLLP